uniref:Uncharacterized protein n=1 Tax=Macaca fascicularis TaxID=9541 RepID=Q9GMQ3_MACFA|nr:hypothetical protein [Macaca fascicularis]
MYYGYVRCYCLGKLGKGYREMLCNIFATSCESKVISKEKKFLREGKSIKYHKTR